MNRFVVYTAIFNNYDWLKDPVVVPKGIDFICYTDSDKVYEELVVEEPEEEKVEEESAEETTEEENKENEE